MSVEGGHIPPEMPTALINLYKLANYAAPLCDTLQTASFGDFIFERLLSDDGSTWSDFIDARMTEAQIETTVSTINRVHLWAGVNVSIVPDDCTTAVNRRYSYVRSLVEETPERVQGVAARFALDVLPEEITGKVQDASVATEAFRAVAGVLTERQEDAPRGYRPEALALGAMFNIAHSLIPRPRDRNKDSYGLLAEYKETLVDAKRSFEPLVFYEAREFLQELIVEKLTDMVITRVEENVGQIEQEAGYRVPGFAIDNFAVGLSLGPRGVPFTQDSIRYRDLLEE